MREGQPSRTAWGAAMYRAAHQWVDGGTILDDPLATRMVGLSREVVIEHAGGDDQAWLRDFIAARQRYAEDAVAATPRPGQAVVLGAGLDTMAYRGEGSGGRDQPGPARAGGPAGDAGTAGRGLRWFEVDHPATATWKREHVLRLGIPEPPDLVRVGVDFEHDDLHAALLAGGLDPGLPVVVAWLGVTPYLTPDAIAATLRALATLPRVRVVFDYRPGPAGGAAPPPAGAARLVEIGEPLQATYAAGEMAELLAACGFADWVDLGRRELVARYAGADVAARQHAAATCGLVDARTGPFGGA